MNTKTLVSQTKRSNIIILIVGGIGALLIGSNLIKSSLQDEYPQLVGLILGLICVLMGLLSLVGLFFIEKVVLKKNELLILSFGGRMKKKIHLTEIESYKEIEKESKSSKWKELTVFTKKSKYTIYSHTFSNYEDFKKVLTNGKKKNEFAEKLWQYKITKRNGIGFLIGGILFLLIFGNVHIKKNQEVQIEDLSTISGTVLEKIEIKQSGKRNRNRSIELKLKEYPKFIFKIRSIGLRATNTYSLISNVEVGEKLELDILTDQYQKKITKEFPLNFWDKSINYRWITIYGISDEINDYFSLRNFNRIRTEDSNSLSMFLLFGFSFFLIGYGIYMILKNKKPAANNGYSSMPA